MIDRTEEIANKEEKEEIIQEGIIAKIEKNVEENAEEVETEEMNDESSMNQHNIN